MSRFLVLILLLTSATAIAQHRIELGAVNTSAFPTISFQVRCTSANQLIQNISSSKIILLEDSTNRPITIACPQRLQYATSVEFGIDRSMGSKVQVAKAAAESMFVRFRFPTASDDEVGLWSFASYPNKEIGLSQNVASIVSNIRSVTEAQWPFNGSAIYETMHRAIEDVNQYGKNVAKAIIFFTDGVNNTATYGRTLNDVILRAQRDGIRVYVVGMVAPQAGVSAMQQLSSATGGFFVPDYSSKYLDSIYTDISLEPVSNYFCNVSFTTTSCPDGGTRNLTLQWEASPGDTVVRAFQYVVPRIESQLEKIPTWISPDSMFFPTANSDAIAAFGFQLSAQMPVGRMIYFIPHPPTVTVSLLAIDSAFSSTQINIIPVAGGSNLECSFSSGPLPAGTSRLLLLRFSSTISQGVRWNATLVSSLPRCMASDRILTNSSPLVLSLDTVLGKRNSALGLPMRISGINVPEGIQSFRAVIRLRKTIGRFDSTAAFQLNPALNWNLRSMNVSDDNSEQTLAIDSYGPPVFLNSTIGRIQLRLNIDAPMRSEIFFAPVDAQKANPFFSPTLSVIPRNGLILLSDTCRGDLSVKRVPINQVGPNAPNPFGAGSYSGNSTTRIPFTLAEEMHLRISIEDILGREVCVLAAQNFSQGNHSLVFDASVFPSMKSGIYFVRMQSAQWDARHKLIVMK